MLHPFADEPLEPEEAIDEFQKRSEKQSALLTGSDGISDVDFDNISSKEIKDHKNFLQPINIVLRPHFSSANEVDDAFLTDRLPPQMIEIVGRYRDNIKNALDKLRKHYKIYVETAVDESLQKEAMRLERRYFSDNSSQEQQDFLKLKRYYEKVKTFNQTAKSSWREISKAVDTFMVINATRSLAYKIEKDYLKKLNLIIRQTESFLDEIRMFLRVKDEISDPITGSIKIQVEFDDTRRYTLAAVLGVDESEIPVQKIEEIVPVKIDDSEKVNTSVALNIVLETREHKLNRASLISVPILGSRDWNRTPDYKFEVPLAYFEECIEQFKNSYHVNISEDNIKGPVPTSAVGVAHGVGENVIVEYKNLIVTLNNQIANDIQDDDFPGLAHPDLFLYHCGCSVFYKIILKSLKLKNLGEMLYAGEAHTTQREYPEELIQKILIDWWTDRFKDLQGEEVDSYLTYSRQLEMVKREYRILHEEGLVQVRKKRPNLNYMGMENWITKNQDRVFGYRKIEIFKRFVNNHNLLH